VDLKEYILPKNTCMGGWYIPPHLCDDLIQIFKDNPQHQSPGALGPPPLKINPKKKESTDVTIAPKYRDPSFIRYLKYLQAVIDLYIKKYPEVARFSKFGLIERAQIQYYRPGQGFKEWHSERTTGESKRCLVFMTYLNSVLDGGTHFKYQELTTPAEKGLTLIWPTDFTHTHRGQINKNLEKYIITGWLGYY
jgi:hypothetical protein